MLKLKEDIDENNIVHFTKYIVYSPKENKYVGLNGLVRNIRNAKIINEMRYAKNSEAQNTKIYKSTFFVIEVKCQIKLGDLIKAELLGS